MKFEDFVKIPKEVVNEKIPIMTEARKYKSAEEFIENEIMNSLREVSTQNINNKITNIQKEKR